MMHDRRDHLKEQIKLFKEIAEVRSENKVLKDLTKK